MKRTIHLKLVLSVLGGLVIASVLVHLLHIYQLGLNAYRLLERADRAYEEKKLDKAKLYYARYLSFAPNDADTAQKYAQVLDLQVDSVADRVALVLLMEQVLRMKPNQDALRLRLVHHLAALDRVPEAMDNLRKLARTWPDRAEILHILGWCHDAKKEYVQATKSLYEALRVNPKRLETYALLCEVLRDRLSQSAEAQKAMDDLIRVNPDEYQAHLMRARFLRRQGDDSAAQRDLEHAHLLKPAHPEVLLELADAARAKGQWGEATRLITEGLKKHPKHPDFYKAMAGVKILTDKRAEAVDHLQSGLKHAPKSNELAVLLIDVMIDQNQLQEARARIDDLRHAGIRPTLPDYLTARLRIAEQKWNEAIGLLESVRQDLGTGSEWSSRVHVLLGLSYRQVGDQEQELAAFRRAVHDEPGWATAHLGLGAALLNSGRFEEAGLALEALRDSADRPAGYWVLLSRSRLYRQLRLPTNERSWKEVEDALDQAAREDAKSALVPIARAELLAAREEYSDAKKLLDDACAAHPGNSQIWCARADLAARQDRLNEAEMILDEALKQQALGDSIDLRIAQVRLWGRHGGPDDQAKLARLDSKRSPGWTVVQRARLLRELSDTWYRLGAFDRAETLWRELARDLPKDVRSRFALMEVALQKHQPAAARAWLDELRRIEGDQGTYWRYGAAAIQVEEARGRRSQLDDARKKLLELEQAQKNWPRIAVLLAEIHEREGKFQQAIQAYARALELGETRPLVLARVLELLLERREFNRAEMELARYEQRQPLTKDLARLGAEVALGLREKDYLKLAVKRAESAVALPARDYRDALWLARIYLASGARAKADTLFRDALAQADHTPDAWLAWIDFLTQTNQRETALSELERMTKTLPVEHRLLTAARCLETMQLPEQADQAYQAALRERPRDAIVLGHAADFYRRADQAGEAIRCYRLLIDPAQAASADDVHGLRRQLAVLLAQEGKRQQALELLDVNRKARGDTIADERVRLYVQSLADASRDNLIGKFEETLRLQLLTSDERVLLAAMLEAAGYLGQARAQLAAVIDEVPQPMYLARFGMLLVRNGELAEAKRLLTRLESLEPNSNRVRELRKRIERGN